jgi:hypothetical protein
MNIIVRVCEVALELVVLAVSLAIVVFAPRADAAVR